MKKNGKTSGFTMAEMLIVVAIIAVLGGVGFVAVQNHQRNMAQLECDAIAKEIFVAAQNHLTMADSQGNLGAEAHDNGIAGKANADRDPSTTDGYYEIYYYAVNTTHTLKTGNYSMLDIMLPFGSIDETVRAGGRYIIRYQPKAARVLDVFYCEAPSKRYGRDIGKDDYITLVDNYRIIDGKDQKSKRNNYDGAVVGWYGNEKPLEVGTYLIEAPDIEVKNAEQLVVSVKNAKANMKAEMTDARLKLIITGKTSGAQKAIDLIPSMDQTRFATTTDITEGTYDIVLDDITKDGWQFSKLQGEDWTTPFMPGEDIVIQVIAFRSGTLSNIAYSSEITTNSLFAEIEEGTEESTYTALIGNIRHLENLDNNFSNLIYNDEKQKINTAKQIVDLAKPIESGESDLSWAGFKAEFGVDKENSITVYDKDSKQTTDFHPISPSYALIYDGQDHSIEGVVANYEGNAGLFGAMIGGSKVSNLELVDFNITSTGTGDNGNAGALAGSLVNTTVQNVLARHEQGSNGLEYKITSTSGNAGGLVGDMTGGSVEQCAAALYVQGQTAGGLLGSANATTLTATYSGGHTSGGSYLTTTDNTTPGHVNVVGDKYVGGLIGKATNGSVQYCYSTCSVKANTIKDATGELSAAGGLIGKATDTEVMKNYAAGLVLTTKDDTTKEEGNRGTFLGVGTLKQGKETGADADKSNNHYVSGINGTLGSRGDDSVDIKITVFDMSSVEGYAADEKPFNYDSTWDGKDFSYQTMKKWKNLGDDAPEFLKIHYGDWAEPVALESSLELINAERLTAKVTLPFDEEGEARFGEGQMLTMLIHGDTSKEKMYLTLEVKKDGDKYPVTIREGYIISAGSTEKKAITQFSTYLTNSEEKCTKDASKKELTLAINFDDITAANAHFAELFPGFIPGEDITVAAEGNEISFADMKAVVDGEEENWTEVIDDSVPEKKRTIADKTNSLFAAIEAGATANTYTANIGNIRHLENLDDKISNLAYNNDKQKLTTAKQIVDLSKPVTGNDLSWQGFLAVVGSDAKVYAYGETTETGGTKSGCFYPVTPRYALAYNGQEHSITGIKADNDGNAGLFGALIKDSNISNLALIDFNINGGGNAGALAGSLTNTTVSNVVAYNSGKGIDVNVAATGEAGGLIGSMSGGAVEKSAAAVIVSGKDAGGLIGAASGGTSVSASYSGGHTNNASYYDESKKPIYNVKGTENVGGLIGNADDTTISFSYSTCSAWGGTGSTVGGFVGTASGSIENCYATGLVEGTTKGAFAGSSTGRFSKNLYYEIVNEDSGVYLSATSGGSKDGITALDASAETYNIFVGNPDKWKAAQAYDKDALNKLFGENKYSMQTVQQLVEGDTTSVTFKDTDFVLKHYGDWPAPEALVINTGSAD